MLKKTTLAVIGLTASGLVSAGAMGPVCTPGNVTIGCEANQWGLGIQALYLSALYGAEKGLPVVFPSNNALLKSDWNWGFRAEGSYRFNGGNDISLDWTHYSSDTALSGFSGVVFIPGTTGVPASFEVANQNRLDQINLVMGQRVDISNVDKMRIYGGLQYANIQVNVTNYYNQLPPIFTPFNSINLFSNSDFKGFGPVVGLDYAYMLTPEFSITANGAGSLQYGTSRYNSGFVAQSVGLVFLPVYDAVKRITPVVEAKLGVNYAYTMAQGVMNIEAGYQALNYFNALQSASSVPTNFTTINSFNYGLYGPYFGVKYLGFA